MSRHRHGAAPATEPIDVVDVLIHEADCTAAHDSGPCEQLVRARFVHFGRAGFPACGTVDFELDELTPWSSDVECGLCIGWLLDYVTAEQRDRIDYITAWLAERGTHPSAIGRAAIMLRAGPDSPDVERDDGLRLAVDLEGEQVKCSRVRRQYGAPPEETVYLHP